MLWEGEGYVCYGRKYEHKLALYYMYLYDLHLFLQVDDRHGFGQMLRMTPEEFDILLGLVGPRFRKKNTAMRRAIPPSHWHFYSYSFFQS